MKGRKSNRKPCLRCGKPKPSGQGRLYCSESCQLLYHALVEEGDGCWGWDGFIGPAGLAYITVIRDGEKHGGTAARIAYENWVGSINEGLGVFHDCGTRACVNPKHLVLRQLNSHKTHCSCCGNAYTGNNLRTDKRGYRWCRHCEKKRRETPEYKAWEKAYRTRPEILEREKMRNRERRRAGGVAKKYETKPLTNGIDLTP